MKLEVSGKDIILYDAEDFDLISTFECGQCFRWERCSENEYIGIAYNKVLRIKKESDKITLYNTESADWDNIWQNYFDFGKSYEDIKNKLSGDSVLAEAISFGSGIRILNQEPFETLISFIISASNNIPRIKGIIDRLCRNFGEEIKYMGESYFAFPTPERLAALTLEELSVIRAGFRDKYILAASNLIASGEFNLDLLKTLPSSDAKAGLMKLNGVGNKVADCVLLFGLGKYDSFPIDVWVKRIMEYCYFDGKDTSIAEISMLASKLFGEYGGYAQQYLFYWARENKIGV